MTSATVRAARHVIVPPPLRTARARWSAAIFGLALLAMIGIYHHLWADPSGRLLGSAHHGNDPMQMMWFLRWIPWSVLHGHNPLATDEIYYPHGIALTWNTFVPTLGALAAPLTLIAGAAVSFAVLMTLGPALTALTAFWWLRRHTGRPAPAAVGAFVIAFSPFVVGHLLGHLNLVFLPLLPLILSLLEDLLWRAPRPTRRTACYLAVATAAQIGISEEMLLIVGIAVLVAAVTAAATVPQLAAPAIRRAAAPALAAAGLCLLLASPVLVSQLLLTRPVPLYSQRFHAVPNDFVHSTAQQWMSTADGHRSLLGGAEDGVYIGWPLLTLLALGIVMTWRADRLMRIATITGAVMVSLTLGTNGLGPVWLPWRMLQHLPNFSAVLPARFAFAMWLAIGWLLSRWLTALADVRESAHRSRNVARPGAVVALAAAAAVTLVLTPLASLTPRPVGTSPAPPRVPFFTDSARRSVIPRGVPILLLPIAWPGDAEAMYYQQLADFDFREVGGYGLTANMRSIADTDTLRRLEQPDDHVQHAPHRHVRASAPPATAPTIADGRAALQRVHPAAIVVVLAAPQAARLVALADALAGHGPEVTTGGVSVWLLDPTLRHGP